MGKSGPCCHCGVTSTPLWRNGPPDKPVLCNACGTRWRTKGSLINYTPIHVRDQFDPEDYEVSIVKHTQYKLKEKKSSKVNQHYRAPRNECELPYVDQNFRKALDGDTSNRSSSGSATSYSESCANFESTEASYLTATAYTGSVQSNVWESPKVASKYICAKPTQFEMLTKELQTIMHEQQSSDFSLPSDLLFENESVMGSFEISTGSVLLRNSYPKVKEEESEASSFSLDCKSSIINDFYSGSASVSQSKLVKSRVNVPNGQFHRDKTYIGKPYIQDKDSLLGFINLKDIVNFDVLEKFMTYNEKQKLKRYLASTDTYNDSNSLRTMFDSQHFLETFSYFQQLLQEGIFEPSTMGSESEDFQTLSLKKLVLHNFSKSAWVEHYQKLKDAKNKRSNGGTKEVIITNYLDCSMLTPLKRVWDTINNNISDPKSSMRSLKRMVKSCGPSHANAELINYGAKETTDDDDTLFTPTSTFTLPPEKSSILFSFPSTSDKSNSNHDLLIYDKNINSFPQCELVTLLADAEESRTSFPNSIFSNQTPEN